jgi:F-type H+-transporting ATPase subunit b
MDEMSMTRKALIGALTGWTVLALAAPAFAAEGGEVGGPFSGDIGNALWTLVIFGLVVFVLGKYAWGPLLQQLQTRENFIREALAKADRDRLEAEARLKEYHDKLAAARAEATAIVDEGRRDADVLKHRIEDDARHEASQLIERAKREIEIATETATKELYTLSAKLATDIAGRILGREINPRDHERLIDESIAGLNAAPSPYQSH